MTMCGLSRGGMFSAPMTRWRMPQIHRAAKQIEPAPADDELEARHRGRPERQQDEHGIDGRDDELEQGEQQRAQRGHRMRRLQSPARSAVTAKARSGKDNGVLGELAVAQRLFALAGEHQDRLCAAAFGRLQVAQRVADARYAGQLDAEALADIDEHSRLGLAAIAVGIGGVRAEEHRVDAPADLRRVPCAVSRGSISARRCRAAVGRGPTDWSRRRRGNPRG